MNRYIDAQITNICTMAKTFASSCEFAARQDDGQISKEEAKIIKKIQAATDRFLRN